MHSTNRRTFVEYIDQMLRAIPDQPRPGDALDSIMYNAGQRAALERLKNDMINDL